MTPEAQQIAIAEACGWKLEWRNINGRNVRSAVRRVQMWVFQQEELPDYLNDLNAMHEAEKLLKSEQHFTFQVELARVINTTTYPLNFALLHATATQRAEAFLRTLNLWTES